MIKLDYIEIGKRIKSKRKELKMSQKELGAKVNLSEASISKYESGKVEEVTTTKLNDFATALDVNVGWLLGLSSIRERNNSEIIALFTGIAREKGDFTEEEMEKILDYVKYIKSKK